MKRLLSWLLVLTMLVACLPMSVIPALAVETDVDTSEGSDLELPFDELLPTEPELGSEKNPYEIPYGNPRLGVMVNMTVPAGGSVFATADCTGKSYDVNMYSYDSTYQVLCGKATLYPTENWGSYEIAATLMPTINTLEIQNYGETDINVTAWLIDTPAPGSEQNPIELNVSKAASASETAKVVDGASVFYKVIAAEDGYIKVDSSSEKIGYTFAYTYYKSASYTQVAANDVLDLVVGTSDYSSADVAFTVAYVSDAEIADIEAGKAVAAQIDALFDFNMETLENELVDGVDYATVKAIREAYDALSEVGKSFIGDKVDKLWKAEELTKPACEHEKLAANAVCPECGKFNLYGANMNLGNSLAVKFYIKSSFLSDTDYVEISQTYGDGRTAEPVIFAKNQLLKNGNYLYAEYSGLHAKMMNDVITVVVKNADGQAISVDYTFAMSAYAVKLYNAYPDNAELRAAVVDMINYGAAAQIFFKYDTENLASGVLTDEMLEYASDAVELSTNQVKGSNYYGTVLSLESSILMTMYFSNVTTDMKAVVTYTDFKGSSVSYEVEGSKFDTVKYKGKAGVVINTLQVADGYSVVTVEVYNGENVVASASDSIESIMYRYKNAGYTDAIYTEIMKFAYSARAYLT